jgi:hypothetical protein
MSAMNDTPDDTLPRRRPPARRKAAKTPVVVNEPAVQAILDQALHPETVPQDEVALAPAPEPAKPDAKRRAPRKRPMKSPVPPVIEAAEAAPPASEQAWPVEAEAVVETVVAAEAEQEEVFDAGSAETPSPAEHDDGVFVDLPPPDHRAPPHDGHPPVSDAAPEPSHHHWVYLALAVFLLALGFGGWGVWTTWFADDAPTQQNAIALSTRSDKLSQEVSTLRRSDQISREANRDLERTLAERDEEIAGLRADIAFYERFVGATGQRRGLSVHALEMKLQSGDAWHFVATLTQNLNRGAVNTGQVTLAVEGTRNDRLEKLTWSGLRKQNNAPGVGYSFKYFQQVEGEVMLPKDFKPLRVTVRLVPAGGSAVEQSFPWPDAVRGGG